MQSEIVPAALRRFGDVPVRIDWYGDIVKRLSFETATPYVQVSCTRFPAGVADSNSPASQSGFGLPVALLRSVRMGDIWQGGRRAGSAPLERVTFERVVVDDESASVVPAGLSTVGADGIARHELPFAQFTAHRGHTLSYLARVEIGGGCVLLVPSMEVVRFYFGACGSLLNNMFSGGLAGDILYSHAWKNEDSGTAHVTLDPSLPGIAAATVARIAFDKAAARQFRGIVNAGVRASAHRQRWYPWVGLPLVGVTTITAEGVWIDRETDRAFLVHRVLSCSHPFPFEKLYYRSKFATTKLGKPAVLGKPSIASAEASVEFRLDDAKGTSRSLTPLAVPAQEDKDEVDPFPDLSTKQIRKVKQTARTGFSRGDRPGSSEDGLDLGTGGHADGGRRLGDVTGGDLREEEPSTPPKSMQELLWSRVQLGEKSILNFDAPMGGGPVARIEVRLDDGKDVAYWACRLTLATDRQSAPDISVLVIVAEDGGARDSTEMMLFKVRSMEEITPSKCARLASAFWADDQRREALEDDGVLVGALTKERLATEHGGIALTVVVDRLVNPSEVAEVVPERPRVRAV